MRQLLTLFIFFNISVKAADTTRYVVLTVGKPSGKQLIWSNGPDQRSYFYEFNDRGRGPRLTANYKLKDGLVVVRTVEGVDYFKGPVSESFELTDGVAIWKIKLKRDKREYHVLLFTRL